MSVSRRLLNCPLNNTPSEKFCYSSQVKTHTFPNIMKNQHPIVPPQALIKSWEDQIIDLDFGSEVEEALFEFICSNFLEVYQAGADHELEACCEWLESVYGAYDWSTELRTTRRPNLKEEALKALAQLERVADAPVTTNKDSLALIRRALEQS